MGNCVRYIECTLPDAASYGLLAEFGEAGFDVEAIFDWAQHDDTIFRRNRWQFILTLPLLCPLLVKPEKNLRQLELETLIDCGKPLIDTFATILGISHILLRRVVGIRPVQLGCYWLNHPHALFSALAQLPTNNLPKTTTNWRLLQQLSEILGFNDCPNFLAGTRYELNCLPELQMHRHLLKEHYINGSCPPNLANDLISFDHYFNALCRTVSSNDKDAETKMIPHLVTQLQRRSARRLLADAARWWRQLHRQVWQSQPEIESSWPALPGLPWSTDDLQAVSLCSLDDLRKEGECLSHCIGTYQPFCLLGNSHIVSVRDRSGNSLSTAEITLIKDPSGHINQLCINHAGAENEPPTEASEKFLEDLMGYWQHPRFQAQFAELITIQKTQNAYLLRALGSREKQC